jgi:TRAP-type transport system small permease protein
MAETGTSRTGAGAREGLSTFAALVLAAVMMVSVVDVVGRYVFNRPLPGSSEITEILMAILIYAGLPLVSLRRAHIAVDLLDPVTPPGLTRIRDAVVGIVSVFVLAIIAWRLWAYADQIRSSKDVTEYLKLPLAPFAYAMSVLAGIAAVVELYRTLRPAPLQTAATT